MDAQARRRFARHLLLAEVGEAGQALLCAARASVEGEPRASEVARTYLERGGVQLDTTAGGETVCVESCRTAPGLEEAAAFVAGAFAATEHIKKVLGVGVPGALPPALFISEDA
jgi:hypothetical protein